MVGKIHLIIHTVCYAVKISRCILMQPDNLSYIIHGLIIGGYHAVLLISVKIKSHHITDFCSGQIRYLFCNGDFISILWNRSLSVRIICCFCINSLLTGQIKFFSIKCYLIVILYLDGHFRWHAFFRKFFCQAF